MSRHPGWCRTYSSTPEADWFAAFELASPGDVEVGHRLRGKLESELCFALENLTSADLLDVRPLGQFATVDEAKKAIGA